MEGIRFLMDGGIWGLPDTRGGGGPSTILYNKDIFDMFGVPYPEDDKSWDEIIDLAARVTGERDGENYYGLAFFPEFLVTAISVGQPILDAETDEANLLENLVWRRAFDAVDRIYSIPGMIDPADPEGTYDEYNHWDGFGSGQVAMTNLYHPGTAVAWLEEGINFDMVAGPTFQDGVQVPINVSWSYLISPYSEHKEDAFRIIEVLLSDEMLIWRGNDMGDTLRLPTSDSAVLEQVELPDVIEEINYAALFYHEAGPPVAKSAYESAIRGNMQEWFKEYILGDRDEVEFLRYLEEEINQQVQELKTRH
jgi:multiple sugar transport system substrate-binding protein